MTTGARTFPGVWMVALPAVDGKSYVYRVYAPADALPGDLFRAAFHHHDEARLPRASDTFDAARIWPLSRAW
jgi:hypothetical protein